MASATRPLPDYAERRAFWVAVCENAAASEVVVNLALPWCLCRQHEGTLNAPSDFTLNSLVLILNLFSSYLEGFAKSARLLTQTLRNTRKDHYRIFALSHAFSAGFLNVSSSFPDVGGGGSDVALATGSVLAGCLYILANMLGSLVLYRIGRLAGWRCMQRHSDAVTLFAQLWPIAVRTSVILAFSVVTLGSLSFSYEVPLDLNDPEIHGIDNVRFVYDEYEVHVPPQPLGLGFGIAMSALGCVVTVLVCEVLFEERLRVTARLAANFASTVIVLVLQQSQARRPTPSFVLMKFSSSFCGAFSAFSGTIGDVADDCFGCVAEEGMFDEGLGKERPRESWVPSITGIQNFMFHWLLTVLIMMLGIYTGPIQAPPIILKPHPGILSEAMDASWGIGFSSFGIQET